MPWRESYERARSAYREWQAEDPPREPPDMRRYVITFECDRETLDSVLLAIKGFGMRDRRCREVPHGWNPGAPL